MQVLEAYIQMQIVLFLLRNLFGKEEMFSYVALTLHSYHTTEYKNLEVYTKHL